MARYDYEGLLGDAAARATRYLADLDARSVAADPDAVTRLSDALEVGLPDGPTDPADVLDFLDRTASPATVGCAGGRYFGFVTGGALPATLASNWLAGAWDQNCFSSVTSPAIALIEEAALRWTFEALGLPATSGGALVTGATMANFACLAAARHRVLANAGWDVEADGLFGAPDITVVVGAEAHTSIFKVLGHLGFGRTRVITVPVDDQGRMRADALPQMPDGPAIVCVQAGNINSGAFDPASEIIAWAHAANAWVHVDGAIGLWALATPSLAHLAAGYEAADSWATDAHKWLNVPYDNGIAIVRDREALYHAMSLSAAYITTGERREPINYTPDNSRRARAVDIWAAFKTLGRSGLAEMVERNCAQARRFGEGLRAAGAEVLNDVVLNQVVVAFGDDERTERVIAAIQNSGVCWCSATHWKGRHAMRISVSSWATSNEDVEVSLTAMIAALASS